MPGPITITSDRLLDWLKCPQRLHLGVHRPEAASGRAWPPAGLVEEDRLILPAASGLHPGGVWAGDPETPGPDRAGKTLRLASDPATRAVYHGLLQWEDLQAEADILARNRDGSWDLALVRTGAWIRDAYIYDLALAQDIMGRLGFEVRHAGIARPAGGFVRPEGSFSPEAAFEVEDFMHRTVDVIDRLPGILDRMRPVLNSGSPPGPQPGARCFDPRPCPFADHCRPGPPPACRVRDFYRMSGPRKKALLDRGVEDIRDLPDDEKLTRMQQRIKDALLSGRPHLDPALARRIKKLPGPLHYLDFETVNPALPLYPGDGPLDFAPFQFALAVEEDGGLTGSDFLPADGRDPRPELARALLESVRPQGAIFCYTMYEREVIGRLAERFPDLAPDLLALADRLVDLCALVVRHLYHPGFGQSFSLKNVVPALAPELTYDNLAVPDGRSAGLAFLNLVYTRDPARRRRLRRDLLRYCGRDALGMAAVKRWVLGEPPVQQNS